MLQYSTIQLYKLEDVSAQGKAMSHSLTRSSDLVALLVESVEHCKMMLQYESATRYWSTKNSLMSVTSSGYLKFEHPDRLQDIRIMFDLRRLAG
jgi:hypothetical protein